MAQKHPLVGKTSLRPPRTGRGGIPASPTDTRCREIEEALRQWVDALGAINDPIFIHDRDFRIVRANQAYADCAGMPADAFVGRPYWEVFPLNDGPLPGCLRAINRHDRQEESDEVATEEGKLFHSRSFAIYNPQGEYFHSVHIMEDVTGRRQMEEALRQSEEHHRQIVETSQEGIWVLDADGRTRYLNPRMAGMLGRTEEEVLGRSFLDFLDGASRGRAEKCFSRCMSDGNKLTARKKTARCFDRCLGRGEHLYDFKLLRKDGSDLWVMASASPMFDSGGNFLGVLGMLVDITDRRRAEEKLRLAAQVFDSTAESIMILDAERKVVDVNLAFTEITGYTRKEVLGRRPWMLEEPQDEGFFDSIWESLETRGHWRGEAHNRRKSGEIYPELLNISVVRDENRKPKSYIVVFSDITDLKSSQQRLEYLANHDRMTGLPNRNLFYDRLQHGLEKALRGQESLAVMFVDLDNFKTINDTLGHEIGDLLLSQVADRLRSCTRKQDTVARLGGDEFTVLAEDVINPESMLAATARRIIDSLSASFDLNGNEVLISASVGIALYPDNGGDLATLLKNADAAMYQAKQVGKNNYQFFTDDMNARATQRATLEQDLRRALKHDELSMVYQPQIELETGRVIGMEALLRWHHPQLGLVSPQQFIPVAESSGLIVQVGDWVMHSVCRQLREWSDQGLDRFRVAVNLSARQFRQKDLIQAIRRIVAEKGTDPNGLEIELTESAVMEDVEKANLVLKQLKDMGMRIAIDDFGMGYSSLNYLKRFPIDRLKIDSHFTQDVATNADDAAIATAIITMGHSLHLKVVAEGVENVEQMEFLKARECDFVQGFYLGHPLPAEQAVVMLRRAQGAD